MSSGAFNVLVVEDEYLIAIELRTLLREGGYSVVGPVASVAGALAIVESNPPDACVLDVNLRGEHSAPVARALKAHGVPFLLSSAYPQYALDQDEAFAGVTNVGKPAPPAALLAKLASLLGEA